MLKTGVSSVKDFTMRSLKIKMRRIFGTFTRHNPYRCEPRLLARLDVTRDMIQIITFDVHAAITNLEIL